MITDTDTGCLFASLITLDATLTVCFSAKILKTSADALATFSSAIGKLSSLSFPREVAVTASFIFSLRSILLVFVRNRILIFFMKKVVASHGIPTMMKMPWVEHYVFTSVKTMMQIQSFELMMLQPIV